MYAVTVGILTGIAALVHGPSPRLLLIIPGLVPLIGPTFSRFFVSTYSEPAGLLGTYGFVLGIGIIVTTKRHDWLSRIVGLTLLCCGGVLAATAKTAYLPILLLTALICALTSVRIRYNSAKVCDHLIGATVSLAILLLPLGFIVTGVEWQQRNYEVVNVHNLVFTLVLAGVGGKSATDIGLPAASADFAGRAYFPEGVGGYPGSETILRDPATVRLAAYKELLENPVTILRALNLAVKSTLGANLTYLPATPLSATSVPLTIGTTVGEQGAYRVQLLDWLNGLRAPMVPAGTIAAALILLIVGNRKRNPPIITPFSRLSIAASGAGLALAAVAVLGDGFFEIAKHVWLAAYLIEVSGVSTILALAAFGWQYGRERRNIAAHSTPK